MVAFQTVEPGLLLLAEHARRRLFGERMEGSRVSVPDQVALAALLEPLQREFPDRLQHQEPRFFEVRQAPQQALVSQLVQPRQHVDTDLSGWPADELRLLQVP